ncbi:MAG: glucose-1-phosphate thymidylyltransferase [Bacteroides sp.]|nr:glucose-1-phosphate thymidylyltransferase [Bacteroides sp.]
MHKLNQIVLFDTELAFLNMLPLSATRPLSDLRIGILTIREKWHRMCPDFRISVMTMDYLNPVYSDHLPAGDDILFVAGNVIPTHELISTLMALPKGEALLSGEDVVAFRGSKECLLAGDFDHASEIVGDSLMMAKYVFDIFLLNPRCIEADFELLTRDRVSRPLPEGNTVIGNLYDAEGRQRVFIEEGASIEAAVFNVKEGPIYIGSNAEVMECASLRGPLAVCEYAKVKMGSRVYGGCTFGPYCKVGGEIDNAVMFGYSNKAHDGYLGNAVIGEWCNIGAGTNASNLKNDYSKIRVWNYATRSFMRTDLQFCGLIMGDHSKAGINCMFNTATVVGVGCNIHGAGFPRVFIPSFSEGSPAAGFADVSFKSFCTIAERVMSRRGKSLDEKKKEMYAGIYAATIEAKAGKVKQVKKTVPDTAGADEVQCVKEAGVMQSSCDFTPEAVSAN